MRGGFRVADTTEDSLKCGGGGGAQCSLHRDRPEFRGIRPLLTQLELDSSCRNLSVTKQSSMQNAGCSSFTDAQDGYLGMAFL